MQANLALGSSRGRVRVGGRILRPFVNVHPLQLPLTLFARYYG